MFVLINMHNGNTELQLLHTLNNFLNILEFFEGIQNKNVELGGVFYVILNPSLDSEGDKKSH